MGISIKICALIMTMYAFGTTSFYKALSSDSEAVIKAELKGINPNKSAQNQAYFGALTMKCADFGGGPAQKLQYFRKGKKELEAAIQKEPLNAEFRLIRLTIQEKCPRMLNYRKNINEDKQSIIKGFSKFPTSVKRFVTDYAKVSNVLNTADLK